MSDLAFGDEQPLVNLNAGPLVEAVNDEPPAELQAETRAEPDHPETSDERIARLEEELEPTRSPDYIEGFTAAAKELGAEIEHEFGSPEWVEAAQAEVESLRQQQVLALQATQTVIEEALNRQDYNLASQAQEMLDGLTSVIELAEFERQSAAEAQEMERQTLVSDGLENIGQWISETSETVGADDGAIDGDQVLQLATDAYGRLIDQHGKEAADQMVPELIQKTVAHLSNELEAGAQFSYETAENLAKALGGKADPVEISRIASEVYQRALYKNGGDTGGALRESLLGAAKEAAGFSEKSQPANMSLASLYATIDRAIPREPEPQPRLEVKLDRLRDAQGRFTVKPLAETYNRNAIEKTEADLMAEKQKLALKQAFSHLGGAQ